jgi:tetratricopeptide (TPR) repeat protein
MIKRLVLLGITILLLAGCGGNLPQEKLDALADIDPQERIPRLEQLIVKHPDDYRLTTLLAKAHWEAAAGRASEEKIEIFKGKLRAEPEQAVFSKLLGDAFYDYSQGDGGVDYVDSALFAYENAALKDPRFLSAVGMVGALYDEKQDFDQAIFWYERALEIEPDHVKTLCNMGASHYNKGEYPRAIDCYRQALAIDPLSQDAHYNLGVAFAEASMYKEAIVEWDVVAEIAPSTPVAMQAKTNANMLRDVLKETLYKGGRKSRHINLEGEPETGH